MKLQGPPPFKKERQRTDDSLNDERGKTDDSFEAYREKAESETDETVSANRVEADGARLQRRSDADLERDEANPASKRRLLNERNLEDSAIQKERTKNDIALEVERSEKDRLLNKLLSVERETTDKNLHGERVETDIAAGVAAKLLNVEQAAHLDTKSALTTREEFVAIVSHDLRNPIGAILSSAEMLAEDVSMKAIGGDARRWIDIIKRNAKTSLRLIGDILDMERIAEGKLQMQMATCSVGDLIRESVENHAYAASEKNITIEASVNNFEGSVTCDKDRVSQVLSNLLGNALKFTPNGGSIHVTAEDSKDEIKVAISDTGPGIPDAQKNRIFEKFTQIGDKSRNGLGLGLYISKTLVESHHGKLWVTSSKGNGSTFSFTLPRT